MIITDKHISIARKIAIKSDIIKARMSCIAITKNGRVICSANNRRLQGDYIRWSLHAEQAIIKKLNKLKAFHRFNNITIFVFRISSNGICLAKPCLKCQKLLSRYNVKVIYTTNSGKIECL